MNIPVGSAVFEGHIARNRRKLQVVSGPRMAQESRDLAYFHERVFDQHFEEPFSESGMKNCAKESTQDFVQ